MTIDRERELRIRICGHRAPRAGALGSDMAGAQAHPGGLRMPAYN